MKHIVIVCLLMLGIAVGCAWLPVRPQPPVPLDVLEKNIQWAHENIETLEQLPLSEMALKGLQQAKSNLDLAESSFAEGFYDEAYFSALDSLAISQELVQAFYKESVISSARETKRRIEAITSEDPDNPLQEFLPMLSEILDYSEDIDASRQDFDLLRVLADFENVTEISQHAQNTAQRTLESALAFESGEYKLSDRGKAAIEEYCREALTLRQEVADLYPEHDVLVQINIVGYSDPVDFKEGTNLLKILTVDTDPQTIPQSEIELRKFLNRRLSEFRVAAVGKFVQQYFHDTQPEIRFELHGTGLGEEFPPDVSPPEIFPDPRRRICKMYTYILLQPIEK